MTPPTIPEASSPRPKFGRKLGRGGIWGCVLINQFAFPGLGTIMAGRRVGYAQAAVMVIGFLLTTGFMVWFIVSALALVVSRAPDEAAWKANCRAYAWAWQSGSALCVAAWLWSLASSIAMLRQQKKAPDLPKP
jgi:hypothetical protein